MLVEPGGFKTGIWEELERDIVAREAEGTRHGPAYRRSLQGQRLMEPIMGDPRGLRARHRDGAHRPRHHEAATWSDSTRRRSCSRERLTPTFVKDRVLRIGLGL